MSFSCPRGLIVFGRMIWRYGCARSGGRGRGAMVLENDLLRVVVLPEQGARIASHRPPAERLDALWSPPVLRAPAASDRTAWLTPIIRRSVLTSACRISGRTVTRARDLPDHGEAWSVRRGRRRREPPISSRRASRSATRPFRFTRLLDLRDRDNPPIRLDYTLRTRATRHRPASGRSIR